MVLCFAGRAIPLKRPPLVVGPLTLALALAGIVGIPNTASAQAGGQGQDSTVVDASPSGRAPGFPADIQTGYIPVAANDLGITAVYLNYPNYPDAVPQVRVRTDRGAGDALYYGFNNEGIWLIEDLKVPKSGGKPFTMKIVDGKAVFRLQSALPRGLKNPTGDYLAMGLGDEKPAAAVASNEQTTGKGQRRPLRPGILNNPDVAETLSTVGRGGTTAPEVAKIDGTGARVDAAGLLTFQGSDKKMQSYRVERISQGVREPGKPLMGAFLYTAPDGKSGILFTLTGTPDGRVSGMPLNATALGMLKPKPTGQ